MEREQFLEKYNKNTHLIGRIVSVTTLLLLVGAPFLIGNSMPLDRVNIADQRTYITNQMEMELI